MPVDRKIHNWDFTPVVQIGQKVCLLTPSPKYFEVEWIEPIPWIKKTWSSVGAGDEKEEELKELYVEDDEFAQYRFAVITSGFEVTRISCPKEAGMWVTKETSLTVPDHSTFANYEPLKRLQLLEFYQWKDTKRYMTLKNTTSSAADGEVVFFGYVFKIKEIEPTDVALKIPVVSRLAVASTRS